MDDNYKRMEAYLERTLDWNVINRNIQDVRPVEESTFKKEIQLGILRYIRDQVQLGKKETDFLGFKDHAEKSIIVNTKRDESIKRLIEQKVEISIKDVGTITGLRAMQDFISENQKIEQRELDIKKHKKEEIELKREVGPLFSKSLFDMGEVMRSDLSDREKSKRLTSIRITSTKERAFGPENIKKIITEEIKYQKELKIKSEKILEKNIQKTIIPLRQKLIFLQMQMDDLYGKKVEEGEHTTLIQGGGVLEPGKKRRTPLKSEMPDPRAQFRRVDILDAEIDDAIRLYLKEGDKIKKEAEITIKTAISPTLRR